MHNAVRPTLSSGGALAPLDEPGSGQAVSGPLKVVFSAPQGEALVASEVSVVFDRPVQALGVAADTAPPLKISPAVRGSFRWVGSRAVVFTPELGRLPGATRYEVEVPAGLRALDGSALRVAHRFAFETPRPVLVRSQPYAGARGQTPDTEIRVELSQAVLPEELAKNARLTASKPRGQEQLAFDVIATDPKRPKVLVIRPKKPLPVHSGIELRLLPQLTSVEGPLSAGIEQSVSFRTYDPLTIQELSCERETQAHPCAPESSVALVFSSPVQMKELQGKVKVTPDVGLSALFASPEEGAGLTPYAPLKGRFQAGGRYKIEVAAGVKDGFGQRLANAFSGELRFADYYPRVDIGTHGRNFSAGALSVPVASRNVQSFDLLTAALGPEDLLGLHVLREPGGPKDPGLGWLAGLSQTSVRRVATGAARNQIGKTAIDAVKLLGGQGRGILAIGARYAADSNDYGVPEGMKVVSLSDLGISAKVSRHGSLVWVTRRSTNTPVDGAEVRLLVQGRPERKYLTRSDGLAHIPASDFAPNLSEENPESRAVILARIGEDTAFQPVSEFIDSYRLPVPTDFSGGLGPYGVAFTDRGIYRPGDEVAVKGIVRNEVPTGNALPGEKSIRVVLRAPSGEELGSQQTVLTAHGTFSVKLRLPLAAELGTHEVVAVGLGHERVVHAPLEVAEYKPVEMRVEANLDRSFYVRGDRARLEVAASYLFGAPMAGAAVSLSVSRQPTWFSVPDSEGFVTDADQLYSEIAEQSPAGELRRENRKLDEHGRVTWPEQLDFPGQRGPELLRLDAEVTDVSRRTVATSSAMLVHPASFYLGLKTESAGFVSAPGKLAPQVVAFDLAGKRLGGRRVTLELL